MLTGYLWISVTMYMDNLKILGFRANIVSISDTLDLINSIKKDDEIIQLLNADALAGANHIIHGVNQAFLAFGRGENLAKDISVEIALRCSAQRQISKAFKILGLREGEMNLCAILINCDDYTSRLSEYFTLDNSVLESDVEKLAEIYDISPDELKNNSIDEIMIDRITKLNVDY